MKDHSKVLLDFGTWEITVRELIFGIMLFAIYIIGGFCIYGVIDRSIEERNAQFQRAVWVRDDATFENRFNTDARDAFVYGEWSAVDTVNFSDWHKTWDKYLPKRPEGSWAAVRVRKEHYTMHTRTVTTSDGKGHTRTHVETYWTWDTVYNKTTTCREIKFAGLVFPYGTVDPELWERVDFVQVGNDRWSFFGEKTETSGIAILHIEDKDIGTDNRLYVNYQNTTEDFEALLNSKLMGNWPRILFWVIFSFIGVGLVIAFCYLDNDWLNYM